MPKLVVICAVLAVLVGCAGKPRVRRPGADWLQAIRVEGNATIDADDLVPGLSIHRAQQAGRALDPYQLSLDTERIRAAYVRLGFFEVSVTPRVDTRVTGEGASETAAQTVTFTVVEGRRSTLAVVIRGLPPEVPEAAARALIELPDGAPFVYAAYDDAKAPMVALVEDAGYPHVQIDAAVLADRQTGVATARFDVIPGPRATFGTVEIEGVEGELADAIRGRLTFAPGDTYSASALRSSQRDVFALGRFSIVRIEPDRTAGATVPVRISVARAKLRELKLGGGFGFDDATWQVRARFGITYVLERRPLWNVGTDLRPAIARFQGEWQPRLRARGHLHRLEFLRPRLRLELDSSFDYLAWEAYTVTGLQVRAGLSSPLGVPWLTGRVGWVFEALVFSDIKLFDPVPDQLGLDRAQQRGAYELTLELDRRDDPINPRRGVYASLRAALGTALALGAANYTQLLPELRGYVPLGPRVVLAGRARIGLLHGEVPVTERFFSGGPARHRGFAERQLSPRAPGVIDGVVQDIVIGGEAMIETGIELRIPIGELAQEFPFGTELFLDGGDVVATPGNLDASNLYWAAGVGVYLSVFGVKVRAGAGELLTRRTQDGFVENLQLYLAVGDAY